MKVLEEFGDYLIAHGVIHSWRITGAPDRGSELVLEAFLPGNRYVRAKIRAVEALMGKGIEELPIEYAVASNELAKMYLRLRLQGDLT